MLRHSYIFKHLKIALINSPFDTTFVTNYTLWQIVRYFQFYRYTFEYASWKIWGFYRDWTLLWFLTHIFGKACSIWTHKWLFFFIQHKSSSITVQNFLKGITPSLSICKNWWLILARFPQIPLLCWSGECEPEGMVWITHGFWRSRFLVWQEIQIT